MKLLDGRVQARWEGEQALLGALEGLGLDRSPWELQGLAAGASLLWHYRLWQSVQDEVPPWTFLVGFNAMVDLVLDLEDEEVGRALEQLVQSLPEELMEQLRPRLDGAKTRVESPEIFHRLLQLAEPSARRVLGGQAGNLLFPLAELGASVVGSWPYHSSALADLMKEIPGQVRHLRFEEQADGQLVGRFGEVRKPCFWPPERELPARYSLALQHADDRTLFTSWAPLVVDEAGFQASPWDRAELWLDSSGDRRWNWRPSDTVAWPFPPGFWAHLPRAAGGRLVLRLVEPEQLAEIASRNGLDYALVGGLEYLSSQAFEQEYGLDRAAGHLVRERLLQQLYALKEVGVRTCVEVSGPPGLQFLELLQRLCRDGVLSLVGINGKDELGRLASLPRDHPVVVALAGVEPGLAEVAQGPPQDPWKMFLWARALARYLEAPLFYVHTTDLDLVLLKGGDRGRLLNAVRADITAKGMVLAFLLQRRFGKGWPEHEAVRKLTAGIREEAFSKLAGLAVRVACQARGTMDEEGWRLFRTLLEKGCFVASEEGDYSLAAVPVMWPLRGLPRELTSGGFTTTGAGDMTFGLFTLFMGP